MTEYLAANGCYLNLDGSRQALVASFGYINDRTTSVETTFFRPLSDVSAGNWTPSTGAALFSTMNESAFSDAEYSQSGLNPTADAMKVRFGAPGTRPVNTNHTFRYRIRVQGTLAMTVRLKQGVTTIKTWTHSPAPTSYTTFEQTLTEGEAATLTAGDAMDLEVEAG